MSMATEDDIANVPKLRIAITDPDGEEVFTTWQDARPEWRNVLLVFDEKQADVLGQEIGASYWDVPDPTMVPKLEDIIRALVRSTSHGAVGVVRDFLGNDLAEIAANVLNREGE